MKLQEYLNMQDEYIIQHLTLNENMLHVIDKEDYKGLYCYSSNNDVMGFHLLTYSNDVDMHNTEFYVNTDSLCFAELASINDDDIKLQIKYNSNNLTFILKNQPWISNIKVPIIYDLVDKQISYELSQLLKQKYIDVHFISQKDGLLYKEHNVKVIITEKMKSIIVEFLELFLNCYNLDDQKSILNFDDVLIHNEVNYLRIPIARDDIEKMNVSKYSGMLSTLYPSVLITHAYCEKVDFILKGYENEQREIWQIPEVRKFIKKLNEEFHQWLYFFDKKSSSLYWITMCLCGRGFGEKDKDSMNHLLFNDFLNEQFKNLSELSYYLNDSDMNKKIKDNTYSYYHKNR